MDRSIRSRPGALVAVAHFPSLPDAQVAKGVLDEANLESMIRTDDAGGMYPGIGGAEILVHAEDAARAFELLEVESDQID